MLRVPAMATASWVSFPVAAAEATVVDTKKLRAAGRISFLFGGGRPGCCPSLMFAATLGRRIEFGESAYIDSGSQFWRYIFF